jgi:phospholipid-binding lipoprotein MlaA
MSSLSNILRMASLLALAAAIEVAGPAAAQSVSQPSTIVVTAPRERSINDPLEHSNRRLFAFNETLDQHIVRPAAVFVHHLTPGPLRVATGNFLRNLGEPVVALNDVLQARPTAAGQAATRFVFNSTVGVGGLVDVATKAGFQHHDNGFALTLGRWGVAPGAYLYAPVLGPSSVRDSFGALVDLASNPFSYVGIPSSVMLAPDTAGGLETRVRFDSDLKSLHAVSTDPYATMRSVYLQGQEAKVTGGKIDVSKLPDFGEPETPAKVAEIADAGGIAAAPSAMVSDTQKPEGVARAATIRTLGSRTAVGD